MCFLNNCIARYLHLDSKVRVGKWLGTDIVLPFNDNVSPCQQLGEIQANLHAETPWIITLNI